MKAVGDPDHNPMIKKRRRRSRGDSASFAKRLTTLMTEKGVGVRQAAGIADVSPSTIVSWRAGAAPEDYSAVKRVAQGLGTTLSFLLTGEDDSRPPGVMPAIAEVFSDGGALFDGYARIRIERLVPKTNKSKGE